LTHDPIPAPMPAARPVDAEQVMEGKKALGKRVL